jgi:hypothetical protein
MYVSLYITLEATLLRIERESFFKRVTLSRNNEITNLFMLHLTSIIMTKANPDLVFIDVTYKTNKYRRPILNIIRATRINKTF